MVASRQGVGRYVCGEPLGSGNLGIVYEAVQQPLGRKVALKLPRPELRTEPWVRARFLAEAVAGSRLRHPNLVPVFDFDEHDGAPFLVMERVPGRLLGELVARRGAFELGAIAAIGAQLLGALAEAHASGIVHGDVRCDNVLLELVRTGEQRARLFDFGDACIAGTPPCASDDPPSWLPIESRAPEIASGEPPRTAADVYGFGVILYQLLTGTSPRTGTGPIVPPSRRCPERGLSPALDAVVLQSLAPDPADRFRDASECAIAFHAAISSEPTCRPHSSGAGAPWRSEVVPGRAGVTPTKVRSDSAQILRQREAVEAALLAGDDERIVGAYLELARSLIAAGRHATAALELEQCVAFVGSPGRQGPGWRVSLTLAALYSGLGATSAAACARTGGAVTLR